MLVFSSRLIRLTSSGDRTAAVLCSAQLSCHDAPIFRLLLKIAVSLRAFNVTLSIFVRLRAANDSTIRKKYI